MALLGHNELSHMNMMQEITRKEITYDGMKMIIIVMRKEPIYGLHKEFPWCPYFLETSSMWSMNPVVLEKSLISAIFKKTRESPYLLARWRGWCLMSNISSVLHEAHAKIH